MTVYEYQELINDYNKEELEQEKQYLTEEFEKQKEILKKVDKQPRRERKVFFKENKELMEDYFHYRWKINSIDNRLYKLSYEAGELEPISEEEMNKLLEDFKELFD